MQTILPAKVIRWTSSTNTVEIEPQFIEAWRDEDGRHQETTEDAARVSNVPVLFPRSGSWAITFPIETGSFGLVTCTKYSLDRWRQQARRCDPGDLRRFGMSGAVFHPVNLYPDSSALSNVDTGYMNLAGNDGEIALADRIDKFFSAFINAVVAAPPAVDNGLALQTAVKTAVTGGAAWNDAIHSVKSTKVKAGGKVGV
jgi:hypothetical protein